MAEVSAQKVVIFADTWCAASRVCKEADEEQCDCDKHKDLAVVVDVRLVGRVLWRNGLHQGLHLKHPFAKVELVHLLRRGRPCFVKYWRPCTTSILKQHAVSLSQLKEKTYQDGS